MVSLCLTHTGSHRTPRSISISPPEHPVPCCHSVSLPGSAAQSDEAFIPTCQREWEWTHSSGNGRRVTSSHPKADTINSRPVGKVFLETAPNPHFYFFFVIRSIWGQQKNCIHVLDWGARRWMFFTFKLPFSILYYPLCLVKQATLIQPFGCHENSFLSRCYQWGPSSGVVMLAEDAVSVDICCDYSWREELREAVATWCTCCSDNPLVCPACSGEVVSSSAYELFMAAGWLWFRSMRDKHFQQKDYFRSSPHTIFCCLSSTFRTVNNYK